MPNVKKPSDRKRNHHNFYLTDEDEEILNIVRKHNSGTKLDELIIYALKKIYCKTNYPNDYNAILITFLSERQGIIKKEIKELKGILKEKEADLQHVEELMKDMMDGGSDE